MVETVKSEMLKTVSELIHILRWEDDGGAAFEGDNPILIFGPGEAKFELKKRLESEGMLDNVVSVDDADNGLTDRQIAKRVRERFPARAHFDIF